MWPWPSYSFSVNEMYTEARSKMIYCEFDLNYQLPPDEVKHKKDRKHCLVYCVCKACPAPLFVLSRTNSMDSFKIDERHGYN